jgi:hypothetical protein
VEFVVDKVALGRLSPSTAVFPANLYSTNFSTITLTYLPGLVNRLVVVAVPKVPPHKLKKKLLRHVKILIFIK